MKFRTIENLRDIMLQSANKVFENKINWNIALWSKAFIVSMAEGVFNIQQILKNAIEQLYPQTSTGEFLDLWGEWEGLPRKTGSISSGKVNFIGDDNGAIGTLIPLGTNFQSPDGVIFETVEPGTIAELESVISSFVVASGVATVETVNAHGLATGQIPEFDITGEGVFTADSAIIVIDSKTFEFATEIEPFSFSAGAVKDYYASINAESIGIGFDVNFPVGSLKLTTDILNIKDDVLLQTAFSGGTDAEKDNAYRARILLSRQQMRGVFSIEQIVSAGLRIDGNTRIIVDEPVVGEDDSPKVAGFQPIPGEAVVYVVRDLADGTIESPVAESILTATKEAIIEFGKLPAHMSQVDLHVFSPILNEVDITLKVFPDTTAMRVAVENSIDAFFKDNVVFDEEISFNALLSAINETQDSTGAFIRDFVVISPGAIPFIPKNITVKGTITFEDF